MRFLPMQPIMTKSKNNLNKEVQESPLFWPVQYKNNVLKILDETRLPFQLSFIKVRTPQEAVKCIREMKTRAFGQFLVVLGTFLLVLNKYFSRSNPEILRKLEATAQNLNSSRPTFPFQEVTSIVIHWAKTAMGKNMDIKSFVQKNIEGYMWAIRTRRLERVKRIAAVIKNKDRILTHCNVSGELAMAAYICQRQKKKVQFYATETRPYLQGAKLTCWELKQMGADVTLVADNAIGTLMLKGLVNKVIVGSDRSCANGDFANKIGTYQIAVLAKELGIPFYVLIQPSEKIKKGKDIPIEIRHERELLNFEGKRILKGRIKGFYPAFDVIPHQLITGVLTLHVN